MESVVIGIILLVIVVIIGIVNSKVMHKEKNEEKKITIEETPSKITIGKEFLKQEPEIIVEKEHIVNRILVNQEDTCIWICPNCETENLTFSTSCCVCNRKR